MEEYEQFVKRIIIEIVLFALAISFFLYLFGYEEYILGWIWGSVGNLFYFFLLSLRVKKASTMDSIEATRCMQKGLVTRLSVVVAVLLVSVLLSFLNILATALGLVGLKLIFYIDHLYVSFSVNQGRGGVT